MTFNASYLYGPSSFTVSPTPGFAYGTNPLTVANDCAAAGGGTIYVQPGTYTVSGAWPAGVTVQGASTGIQKFQVIFNGNQSFTATGNCAFQNIQFSATAGAVWTVGNAGAAVSSVSFENCAYINSGGTGFLCNSAAGQGNITDINGDVNTTGVAGSFTNALVVCIGTSWLSSNAATPAIQLNANTIFDGFDTLYSSFTAQAVEIASSSAVFASRSGQYTASNAAIRFSANGQAISTNEQMDSSNGSGYAVAATGAFGIFQYSLLTFTGSAHNFDPQVTSIAYPTTSSGPIPVTVSNGGTGDSSLTAYSVLTGGTSSTSPVQSVASVGTSGQFLTSQGPAALPIWSSPSASTITITGDAGGAQTASSFTLTGGTSGAIFTGAADVFTESFNFLSLPTTTATNGQILINSVPVLHTYGTTVPFSDNIFAGRAGNFTLTPGTAIRNSGMGAYSLQELTTGQQNSAFGFGALNNLSSGSYNCGFGHAAGENLSTSSGNCLFGVSCMQSAAETGCNNNSAFGYASIQNIGNNAVNNLALGFLAGFNYTGSESSNILLLSNGTIGESNVIRIGTQGSGVGQQNLCFVAGITGASPVSGNTPQVVLCDNAGKLAPISSSTAGFVLTSNGSATPSFQAAAVSGITTLDGDSGSATGSTVTLTGSTTGLTFSGASATVTLSGTLNVAHGGTGDTSLTAYAVLCGGTTSTSAVQSVASVGTTGQVLTSNGAGALPTFQAAASSGIVTLAGDFGSATGSTVTLTGGTSGAVFTGSGATMTESFNFLKMATTSSTNGQIIIGTDTVLHEYPAGYSNIFVGANAGNFTNTAGSATGLGNGSLLSLSSGNYDSGLGSNSLQNLSSGSNNTGLGAFTLNKLVTGSANTAIGMPAGGFAGAGYSYTGAESKNIVINNVGVLGESGVIRIGNATDQTKFFAAGIFGATPVSGNTPQVVLCDNAGNLTPISSSTSGYVLTSNGSATPSFQAAASGGITTLAGDSGSATGSTVTLTGSTTGLTFTGASATVTLGGTLNVAHGGTGDTSLTAYAVLCGGTTSTSAVQSVASVGTTGQVLTSNGAGALPTFQAAPAALTWQAISASQTASNYNGYINTGNSAVVITLPTTAAVGTEIAIGDDSGTGSIAFAQNASQSIRFGNSVTTVGTGGSLTSTSQGDVITIVCYVANTTWLVVQSQGNWTVV
jgi:hypothetical protein